MKSHSSTIEHRSSSVGVAQLVEYLGRNVIELSEEVNVVQDRTAHRM